MSFVDQAITRIRAYRRAYKLPKRRLALSAGLDASALKQIDHDSWNPNADTLRRLEAIIPQNFAVDLAQDVKPLLSEIVAHAWISPGEVVQAFVNALRGPGDLFAVSLRGEAAGADRLTASIMPTERLRAAVAALRDCDEKTLVAIANNL